MLQDGRHIHLSHPQAPLWHRYILNLDLGGFGALAGFMLPCVSVTSEAVEDLHYGDALVEGDYGVRDDSIIHRYAHALAELATSVQLPFHIGLCIIYRFFYAHAGSDMQ